MTWLIYIKFIIYVNLTCTFITFQPELTTSRNNSSKGIICHTGLNAFPYYQQCINTVMLKWSPHVASKHFRCQAPQKTNTSVPRMFQGLLNIEGLSVQHRVSPEPFNLSL